MCDAVMEELVVWFEPRLARAGQCACLVIVLVVGMVSTLPGFVSAADPTHGGGGSPKFSVVAVVYVEDSNPLVFIKGALFQIIGIDKEAYTKSDGTATINNVPYGNYDMVVTMAGYQTEWKYDYPVGLLGENPTYAFFEMTPV